MPKSKVQGLVTEAAYRNAQELYTGWCTSCQDWTRDSTEPDAVDYDCPVCEQNTVMGAEEALIAGEITIR